MGNAFYLFALLNGAIRENADGSCCWHMASVVLESHFSLWNLTWFVLPAVDVRWCLPWKLGWVWDGQLPRQASKIKVLFQTILPMGPGAPQDWTALLYR